METRQPIRFYTEAEIDQLEQAEPDRAYQIARAQALAQRASGGGPVADHPPDPERVREAIADVRLILNRDGGDIDLVGIDGQIVQVRLKGACVGCPNSVIDLKTVVETVLRGVPGVAGVVNQF